MKLAQRIGSLTPLLLCAAIGCSPARGDLAGKVTFQGKEVRSGSVQVVGKDGIPVGSAIDSDGFYAIKDILAGPISVTVNSPDPGQVKVIPRKKDAPPPAKGDRSKWFAIPEKYADFKTSELQFELKAGPNRWDIELK